MQRFKHGVALVLLTGLSSLAGLGTPIAYEVWVANQGLDLIQIFDGTTLRMVEQIEIDTDNQPATSKPHMVLFSPDFQYAYVTNVGRGTVSIVHADTRRIVAEFATGKGAHAAVPSPDGRRVFVANVNENTVTEILTDTQAGTFALGRTIHTGTRPICAMFTADSAQAYVTLGGDPKAADAAQTGGVEVISVKEGAIVHRFPNTGKEGCGLLRSPLGGRAMYANVGHPLNQVMVFDTKLTQMVYRGSALNKDPHGMWITPDGTQLWVLGRQDNQITLFDTVLFERMSSIPVGDRPDLADSSPDGRYLFYTLRGEAVTGDVHSVSGRTPGVGIVDIEHRTQVQIIPLSGDPHGIAVRPLQ